ncbi:MAG: lipid A biosynthesis acyltransferase [Planctomycetes bacterium]|nr:lipid A biosynthesis acyltransferase [Planctomycetota bacterium]
MTAKATAPTPAPSHRGDAEWLSMRERGTVLGIRAAYWLAIAVGRSAMRPLVALVAMWYALFDRKVVRASRAWLLRVHGRPAGFWQVYRHLRTFAQVTLDKVYLLTDHTRALRFTRTGHELLAAQFASGQGAILLGAHLGSYEAMRAGGETTDLPIEILGYFANSRMINSLLARLSPRAAAKVIHLGDDPIGVMTRVQDSLAAGRFIATMGDRTGLTDRIVRAPFFGQEASFPAGPFLLASVLRCPVYLVLGLYRAPDCYDLHCERFAERIELPRQDRAARLQQWVRRYAERVEHHARSAPDNWFNFFDFWAAPPAAPPSPPPP